MAPLLRAGAFLPAALMAGRTDRAAQARAMFAIFGVLGAALQDFSDLPDAELREQLVACLNDVLVPRRDDGARTSSTSMNGESADSPTASLTL